MTECLIETEINSSQTELFSGTEIEVKCNFELNSIVMRYELNDWFTRAQGISTHHLIVLIIGGPVFFSFPSNNFQYRDT